METKTAFRLASARDADGIRNVARMAWRDAYAGIILPGVQEQLLAKWYSASALEAALAQSGSWFYVAADEEKIIGYAQFAARKNLRGELTRIYVLPERQSRGIGKRLLQNGLSALRNCGVEEVFVHVEKENAKGIGFYERNGFRPAREFSIELPGQSLNMKEYVLSLPATSEAARPADSAGSGRS